MTDSTALPIWSLLDDWAGDEGSRDPILVIVAAPDPHTARQIAADTYTTDIDGRPTYAFGDLTYGVAIFRGDVSPTVTGDVEIVHLNHDLSGPVNPAGCTCDADCPFCGAGIGAVHDLDCLWQAPQRTGQTSPAGPAGPVTAGHIHRPGCRDIQRHPGPLFLPAEQCSFCGAYNTCERDSFPSFGGTTEGFERCTACGQHQGWADIGAVI